MPNRRQELARATERAGGYQPKAVSVDSVLGPPSPDQTWEEYAEAATQYVAPDIIPNIELPTTEYEEKPYWEDLNSNDQNTIRSIADKNNYFSSVAVSNDNRTVTEDEARSELEPIFGDMHSSHMSNVSNWFKENNNPDFVPNHLQDHTATNQIYNDLFESEGGIEEDAIPRRGWTLNQEDNQLPYLDAADQAMLYDPNMTDHITLFREQGLDDGTNMNANLTSNYMLGKQYKKYSNAGLGGRSVDDIDDNKVYSKIDEMRNYGFNAYMPDDGTYAKMLAERASVIPSMLANDLANSRENIFDYGINIKDDEGSTTRQSGQEFEDKVPGYIDTVTKNLESDSPDNPYVSKDADHTGMTAFKYSGYKVRLEDGTEEEHSDIVGIDPYGYVDENGNNVYESIIVTFADGQQVEFEGEDDYRSNLLPSEKIEATTDDDPNAAFWVPDFEFDDGTRLTYDQVINLTNENFRGDDSLGYDFGFMNIAKPHRLQGDFITEDAGFNFEDLVPKMYDLITGSAPYFYFPTSIPLGVSNALAATHSIDPQTIDSDGSARLVSEDMDNEKYTAAVLGNAIMPFTEIGLGRIGSAAIKPLSGIRRKYGERAIYPGLEWGIGTFGEGLEEIPGNMVENYMTNGLRSWYGNPVLDDKGNEIIDNTGHLVRDSNTSLPDRFKNFMDDAPEAFIGGSLLGGLFGLRPRTLRNTINETRDIYNQNKQDRAYGLRPYIRPDGLDVEFELDPEYEARLRSTGNG